jgi:glycosyltransferase involved in cell wall biosynthesis
LSLISIIVATYNNQATMQQCIDSIAQQTYPDKELIIIDGGSTDGTVEVLKANDHNVAYWVSEPDRGIYHAWNKALLHTGGDWICFLGADDFFWDKHVLTRISERLKTLSPSIRVVYGQNMLVSKEGESLYLVGEPWEKLKRIFKARMCISHTGMMHRRSLFERHGKFDESFRITGDYEMLLRELKDANAEFVPQLIVAGVRQGGVSSKPESSLLLLHEARRAQRMHGMRYPSLPWVWAMVKVRLRLLLWYVLGEGVARHTLDLARRMGGQPEHWTKT